MDNRVFYVYILASISGALYIGMCNSLERRIVENKQERNPNSHSATYKTKKLVYCEMYKYVNEAIAREKQIKKWNRQKKVFLIEQDNPYWIDLSIEYMQ